MEKIILVDGNNLIFRSYYATAYSGNFMKNSKGFPTNALFGFVNMINKIILEENPVYMIVAFDKGKTFRHEKYKDYKGGRSATPDELKMQMPYAKELLTYMGIKYYEIDNYEADDIIGTFAEYCNKDSNYIGTIISSDKDLLQLVTDDVDIKLLKSGDYVRYSKKMFEEVYGIDPKKMVDLKALMGDASDNLPGVRGIGEKTGIKLLIEYNTLDGIYENIDNIPEKTRVKLIEDKENAYLSYEMATIIKDVPLEISIEDTRIQKKDHEKLNTLYEELEFFSFLKKDKEAIMEAPPLDIKIIKDIKEINITKPCAIYLEILGSNYHTSPILGMGVYNKENSFYIPLEILKQNPSFLQQIEKYTYDAKKVYVALKWLGIDVENITFDTMIASALLDYNTKEDIAYLGNQFDANIPFYENVYGKSKLKEPTEDVIAYNTIIKAKFIYESYPILKNNLKKEGVEQLFEEMEMPLFRIIGDMELKGVNVNKDELINMGTEIKARLEELSEQIYELATMKFNIASPKELGIILFEKLGLKHGKAGSRGYSTSIEILNKLKGVHPIIEPVIEYRTLTKLYSTYIEGLLNNVLKDGKIHTIYTQILTRTGRLSSLEPNLQNIPAKTEYGRLIRKAFLPSENSVILSADYSQIELRVLAHMSCVESLIEAFNNNIDIHTQTASDLFKVDPPYVTKEMRRMAKAVNFGIIYGISNFGLAENIGMSPIEAKSFITDYFITYPGIKKYMDDVVKQAHVDGYVTTLFHRKRVIPELNNKNYLIRSSGERMALNTPIQGTSADIIKLAMIEVERKLREKNLKSKIILQVHDELVLDVDKTEIEKVKEIVQEGMEKVVKLRVPLKVEIEYGDNWYEAK